MRDAVIVENKYYYAEWQWKVVGCCVCVVVIQGTNFWIALQSSWALKGFEI